MSEGPVTSTRSHNHEQSGNKRDDGFQVRSHKRTERLWTICRSIGEYVAVPSALVTSGLPLSAIA